LGVILDSKRSWKPHIEHIKGKVSKNIGIIYNVKHILDEVSLQLLYITLIVPYLTYCIEVWGKASTSYTERLFLLQKKTIRIVTYKGL